MHDEKVREIHSQHGRLAVSVTELAVTSDLYQARLTSLATVGLMLALGEHFGIEFPDSALSRKTFASINSIAEVVGEIAAN